MALSLSAGTEALLKSKVLGCLDTSLVAYLLVLHVKSSIG